MKKEKSVPNEIDISDFRVTNHSSETSPKAKTLLSRIEAQKKIYEPPKNFESLERAEKKQNRSFGSFRVEGVKEILDMYMPSGSLKNHEFASEEQIQREVVRQINKVHFGSEEPGANKACYYLHETPSYLHLSCSGSGGKCQFKYWFKPGRDRKGWKLFRLIKSLHTGDPH